MNGSASDPARILTRREFLEWAATRSVGASLAAGVVMAACRPTADQSSALGLDPEGAETLVALIDEILPASGGMPAASQTGTVAYLELLAGEDPGVGEGVRAAVERVDDLAGQRYGNRLSALGAVDRTAAVTLLAESSPDEFDPLRDSVYEAYYLDPVVWRLLGYEPYPTGTAGPEMTPFDPALLARVRRGSYSYREVPS